MKLDVVVWCVLDVFREIKPIGWVHLRVIYKKLAHMVMETDKSQDGKFAVGKLETHKSCKSSSSPKASMLKREPMFV